MMNNTLLQRWRLWPVLTRLIPAMPSGLAGQWVYPCCRAMGIPNHPWMAGMQPMAPLSVRGVVSLSSRTNDTISCVIWGAWHNEVIMCACLSKSLLICVSVHEGCYLTWLIVHRSRGEGFLLFCSMSNGTNAWGLSVVWLIACSMSNSTNDENLCWYVCLCMRVATWLDWLCTAVAAKGS